jgi:hypothetical protein
MSASSEFRISGSGTSATSTLVAPIQQLAFTCAASLEKKGLSNGSCSSTLALFACHRNSEGQPMTTPRLERLLRESLTALEKLALDLRSAVAVGHARGVQNAYDRHARNAARQIEVHPRTITDTVAMHSRGERRRHGSTRCYESRAWLLDRPRRS